MRATGRFARLSGFVFATALSITALNGCQLAKNELQIDRAADLDRQDYRDGLKPLPIPAADAATAPEFKPVLSTPQELRLPSPLVTVEVNGTVALRELLYQLAQQAGVDIELDPQIHGSVIFTARDRPFDEVVQRICDMASLRYTFANNVLHVEYDRPYVKNYPVGFLNVTRTGNSKITVTSPSSGGNAESKFAGDLWKELNDGLKQVLLASDLYQPLATMTDPVVTPANPNPVPRPVSSDPNAPPPPPPPPGSPAVAPMPAAAAPTLNVTAAPSAPFVPNPPASFSISQQTGNVAVNASERQQKLVQKFLDDFRRRVTTQVLVEAKVLEVDLTDQFNSGVDWGKIGGHALGAELGAGGTPPLQIGSTSAFYQLGLGVFHGVGSPFALTIQALKQFGTVRTLSSPRVTVMNNEPAIVNVTEDNVYFNFTAQVTPATATSAATIAINSTQKNAPDGVILAVIPTANPDTGEIMMTIRPTISNLKDHIIDPTISLTLAVNNVPPPKGLQNNQIPELAVQEIDSMLTTQSGEMVALGGLMRDSNTTNEDGLPIASDIPLLGYLFKSHADTVKKSELIVLLRATIVSGSNVDDAERKVYKVFSLDRHPGNL